jgi:hypothetical protein
MNIFYGKSVFLLQPLEGQTFDVINGKKWYLVYEGRRLPRLQQTTEVKL